MCGFLMRFCKQPLSVLVSNRLVDLRSMSSISVELNGRREMEYKCVSAPQMSKPGEVNTALY